MLRKTLTLGTMIDQSPRLHQVSASPVRPITTEPNFEKGAWAQIESIPTQGVGFRLIGRAPQQMPPTLKFLFISQTTF